MTGANTPVQGQRKTKVGRVVSDKMDKTIVVKVERRYQHPIYKKYIRRSKKYHAHDENNQFKTGDTVSAAFYEGSGDTSLSCEQSADETSWTFVEDIPSADVEQGFKTPDGSPLPLTGGPAAPNSTSSSPPSARPMKWRRFSSSRFKAKAVTGCRRRHFCRCCGPCATSTARWWR